MSESVLPMFSSRSFIVSGLFVSLSVLNLYFWKLKLSLCLNVYVSALESLSLFSFTLELFTEALEVHLCHHRNAVEERAVGPPGVPAEPAMALQASFIDNDQD